MRGNSFGKLFSITSYGESHGPALGVVIDGMPSQVEVNPLELQSWMERRRPGRLKVSSSRDEADQVEILSGVKDNITLGNPIHVMVRNTNQKSQDYDKLKNQYRPGHADKTTEYKFGIRDHRGGGRASGRETLARVIAGYFASLIIPELKVKTLITQLAHFEDEADFSITPGELGYSNPNKESEIENFILQQKQEGNSSGGCIQVQVSGAPKGLGEPVFDKLKAELGKAILSIGSCIGFSYGDGVELSKYLGKDISTRPEAFGGIEGGISNGDEIRLHAYFKAPSTVGDNALEGRHDPCILPRVRVVLESMVYITLADHYLRQQAYLSTK